MIRLNRRGFFKKSGVFLASFLAIHHKYKWISESFAEAGSIPKRVLGKTGVSVTSFGLGGEVRRRYYEKNNPVYCIGGRFIFRWI